MEPGFRAPRTYLMPRHIIALALALGVVPPARVHGQNDPVLASRAAYQQAVHAYEAHDVPAFLRYASEAHRLRPAHGASMYALASAYAMSGDTAAALDALRRFAVLGYTADVAADSDLAPLRGTPAFDRIRAALGRNAAPLVRGRSAFTLPERDLLTEGIAYDPRSRSFFVGSVHRRKVLRVDREGHVTEFVHPGADLPWAPLGMRVDAERCVLWVAAAAVPQSAGFDPADSLRSGLFRFDLGTGALTGRFPIADDGAPHALGDLTITRAGDVYASDSRGPVIFRVRAGADTLERFVTSPLLLSAQGLVLDAGERVLYVADYARGILKVDLDSRALPGQGRPGRDPERCRPRPRRSSPSGGAGRPHRGAGGVGARAAGLRRADPGRRGGRRAVLCGQQPVGALSRRRRNRRAGAAPTAAGAAPPALTRPRGGIRLPPRHAPQRLLRP